MNIYLDRLLKQHADLVADMANITNTAAEDNRDVTKQEADAYRGMSEQAAKIEAEIVPLRDVELRAAQVAAYRADVEALAPRDQKPTPGGGQLERYRSAGVGEYLSDWARQKTDPQAAQRISRAQAEYRVVADQKLADNPGVVPVPIVGDVIGTLPQIRPTIDAVRNLPMPTSGSTFNRPKITQHTSVGVQATEKTQLSSQKMTITSVPVTKATYGGTLDISFQDRDWTDPAILAIVVADLASVYADQTDNAAADGLVAATTTTFVLADGAAEGVIRSAFLSAAAGIFSATKRYPTTAFMSPDDFAMYAAVTNPSGGPAFPLLSDASGSGGSIMGLNVVVDANFAAKTTVIADATQVEHYEQVGGLLSVTEPTILGYTVAYYGYVADLLANTASARKRSLT